MYTQTKIIKSIYKIILQFIIKNLNNHKQTYTPWTVSPRFHSHMEQKFIFFTHIV